MSLTSATGGGGTPAREAASARSASRALCGVMVVGSRSGSSGMIWATTGSRGAGIATSLGAFLLWTKHRFCVRRPQSWLRRTSTREGKGAPLRLPAQGHVLECADKRFLQLAVHAVKDVVGIGTRHRRPVPAILDQGGEDVRDGQHADKVG